MGCAHGSGNKSDHCRLQKAGIAFQGEKQQLRRAPRKAAEKNKSAAQDADYRDQLGGESLCEAWVHIKASTLWCGDASHV